MPVLHKAQLDKLSPDDEQGPYFWLSSDGERYLEVERLPEPDEEDEWFREVDEELSRKRGALRLKIHRRMLDHYGATLTDPDAQNG